MATKEELDIHFKSILDTIEEADSKNDQVYSNADNAYDEADSAADYIIDAKVAADKVRDEAREVEEYLRIIKEQVEEMREQVKGYQAAAYPPEVEAAFKLLLAHYREGVPKSQGGILSNSTPTTDSLFPSTSGMYLVRNKDEARALMDRGYKVRREPTFTRREMTTSFITLTSEMKGGVPTWEI